MNRTFETSFSDLPCLKIISIIVFSFSFKQFIEQFNKFICCFRSPRLAFDEKELNELANSIIKYGVIHEVGEYQDIQPLSDEDNKFINEQDQKQENQ